MQFSLYINCDLLNLVSLLSRISLSQPSFVPNGNIIGVATRKILAKDAALGAAHAALLAVQTATSCGAYSFILEGDALNIVLAIQQPQLYVG